MAQTYLRKEKGGLSAEERLAWGCHWWIIDKLSQLFMKAFNREAEDRRNPSRRCRRVLPHGSR